MTATDIYEHPEYHNYEFRFPNEEWRPLDRKRFSRYEQSNCFRVRNKDIKHIMTPCEWGSSKKFTMKLMDDERKVHTISMNELFDGFDVDTRHSKNGCSEFLMGAF